ncbi:IclR family transcriptional regulator [Geosporobacter ferrireducens]|uniref:IclR family transcriptional regulator n=1 Tax=Geosporobacter ferrireducens TaxID=1424294 RepID=A0A1D8GFG1_9FIRM|nr:IclR family transcriptional regulator [Geosporobacter ferrireducens]AOT69641.1 hypothetical protein Gferi_08660 [Geosporobacter ferrireducens]MTI54654.1 IclR family transcriptional regulator [Geosporobacter ferrireducens]
MDKHNSETWKINVVIKAASILKYFTGKKPQWTLTQLVQETKMPKSTLSNMLKTLEYCDILEKDESNQFYRLGMEILEMSYGARMGLPIIEYAMHFLDEIQQKTGEIVYFTVPRHGKVLYLDASYPANKNVLYSITGKTLNMHCTGVGKAMLSKLSEHEIKQIIDYHGMERFTPTTITNFEDLMKEIKQIRECGYAIDRSEEAHGVKCVAVPIVNGDRVLGAISISGSIISIKDEMILDYAQMLISVANILAQKPEMFPNCPMLPKIE